MEKGSTKSKKRKSISDEDADVFNFLDVLKKKVKVDKIIDDWIDRYHKEAEEAIYELLIFIIQMGGGNIQELTMEVFKDEEIEVAAQSVREEVDSNISYPLIEKSSKNLIDQFQEFWRNIIIKTQSGILFDKYFLEMLVLWLQELQVSHKRAIRHSVVLVSIQITNSIVGILTEFKKELNIVSRQLSSETKNTARQAQLKQNQVELTKKITSLESYLKKRIFPNIFEERFHDSIPEIRSLTIGPLSSWILAYPSLMMNAEFTKHLGHALSDWITDNRMIGVKSVALLYSNETYISQLDSFTQKFRHRIEEIAISDKITAISVEAIKLVELMSRYDLIEDQDILKICKLYQIDNQDISLEAGSLIYEQFLKDKQLKLQAIPEKSDKNNTRYHIRGEQFQQIIDFLEKSSVPVPYYLINSIWEKGYVIFTDWNYYFKYLSELESNDIQDNQLLLLLKIFKASVQIAVGDRLLIYSDQKPPTSSDNKIVISKDISQEITSKFLSILPEILSRYKSNFQICKEIIEIFGYFTLETYIKDRLQEKFKEILDSIREIFLLHPWEQELEIIPTILYRISNINGLPSQLESEFNVVIHEIFKTLLKSLKSTSNQLTSASTSGDEKEREEKKISELVFSLNSDLGKLNSIGKSFHFDDEEYDGLLFSLWKGKFNLEIDEDEQEKIIMLSSSAYANLITWTIYQEYSVAAENGKIVPALNDKLLKIFYMFSEHMYSFLSNPDISPKLQHFAFKLFTDTRLPFSPALDQTSLHFYDINLPMQSPIKICAKNLLAKENQYNINLLRQNFLKELLEKIERKKHAKKIRERFFSGKKKKKDTTKATTTDESDKNPETDTDKDKSAPDTSHSEKETNTDGDGVSGDSESDNTKTARDLIRRDLRDDFQEDLESEIRVDDLLMGMMHSIQCEFVTSRLLIEVLKQLAFSPSKKSLDLITEFVHSHPLPSNESESSIIVKTLVRYHRLCISKEIAGNPLFQKHMFTRMNSLANWMISEAIHHDESLALIIMKSIRFIQRNPNLSKGRSFITIIEMMASKLDTIEDVNLILNDKSQVIFDKRHKYLPFIEKLYTYIKSIETNLNETQTKTTATATTTKGKSRKGRIPKKDTTGITTSSSVTKSKTPTKTKTPTSSSQKKRTTRKKKKPSNKWTSSEEESGPEEIDTDSEDDERQQPTKLNFTNTRVQTRNSAKKNNPQIVNITEKKSHSETEEKDKESSESSEDFEPSPAKKLRSRY